MGTEIPLIYTQLGNDRIQVIYQGKVLYIENSIKRTIEIEKIFSEANKDLNNAELWKQVEEILSNAPQPYFGDFKKDRKGNLYFRDYEQVIPGGIVDKIKECADAQDHSAVAGWGNFQALNMLNVNATAQKELYDFMKYHGITITPRGYLLGYKAVRPLNPKLSLQLQKLLESRKFEYSEDDYLFLSEDGEYSAVNSIRVKEEDQIPMFKQPDQMEGRFIGKFATLYQDLEDLKSGIFVDKHSGKVQQRVGDVLSMPRQDCDPDSSVGCSMGFHVGSPSYVNSFACPGDVILHCLVNPADVVAIPREDVSKLRACQYYIAGFSELQEDGKIAPVTNSFYDSDYATIEQQQIEDELKQGDFAKYIDMRVSNTSIEEAEAIIRKRLTRVNI